MTNTIELSILMPCLNEAETLAACIEKARLGIKRSGMCGEILVADNGSQDASVQIAEDFGARVIHVGKKGYGNALAGGIHAASGRWIVMGDADESYDFSETDRFVKKFREGFELVIGCRLPSGGGRIMPGAMPFSHRWLGNPLFSRMARHMFAVPVHDVYCGLRGFTRELYDRLDLRCEGMEFATEMIIKASLHGARISEIPITLHPEERKTQAPHLRTIRWLAHPAFFSCPQPAMALSGAGVFPGVAGAGWIRLGIAWTENRWRYVRCPHTFIFQSRHSDGLSIRPVRHLRENFRHQ